MKNPVFAIAATALLGAALAAPAQAQSPDTGYDLPNFGTRTADTFIKTAGIEITIASINLDRFLLGVPSTLTSTERAFSQVRPGVNYDKGMVWLTFKLGGKSKLNGKDGILRQLQSFRMTKQLKASYRLTSAPSYRLAATDTRPEFTVQSEHVAQNESSQLKSVNPRPRPTTSRVTISDAGPGDLTVDHPRG